MKTPGDTGELAMIVAYHCLYCLLTQQGWQCVITNLYHRFNKKGGKKHEDLLIRAALTCAAAA